MSKVSDDNINNNLQEQLRLHIVANVLWNKEDGLYLACSGGLDSVVLAHMLFKLGYSFIILHCNFQLRGEESERDEQFVRELANTLSVPVVVKKFDTNREIEVTGKGVQETARNLRYNWFKQVLEKDQSNRQNWLLTAHHADDQVETILMHYFRGTGLAGLQGMKMKTDFIIRPLLFAERVALEKYATDNGLNWVEDSSNATTDYTRNFIRHTIIPRLEEVYPSVKSRIIGNGKHFEEVDFLYQQKVNEIKKRLLEKREKGFAIAVNKLKHIQPLNTVMFEIFSAFGFGTHQIPEIKKLFDASSGKYFLSSSYRVLRNRDWLLIEPSVEHEQDIKLVEQPNAQLEIGDKQILFQEVPVDRPIPTNQTDALLNLEKLKFPLLVRKWKQGDYFYPLGMNKKKKLSRFMTDLKLSLTEKENQWVVESDKKIVWVVGQRIDERFKIDSPTKSRLLISILPQSE